MNSRLASVAPELVDLIDSQPADQARNIVVSLAREAVARTGLDEPAVTSALDRIGTTEQAGSDLVSVQDVVARLDDVAWGMEDPDGGRGTEQYLLAFRRARAASSVAFALTGDRAGVLDSIYEAQAALGSVDLARSVIDPLLRSD